MQNLSPIFYLEIKSTLITWNPEGKMERLKLKRKYSESMIPYQDSTLLRYIHVNM